MLLGKDLAEELPVAKMYIHIGEIILIPKMDKVLEAEVLDGAQTRCAPHPVL